MATEFFNDAELDTMRKALALVADDLHRLSARAHDFSKQRLRVKVQNAIDDLAIIQRTLPDTTEK